jgi:hypothetical protein
MRCGHWRAIVVTALGRGVLLRAESSNGTHGLVAGRRCEMKRLLLVGTTVVGVAVCARRAARGCGGFDFERMIERMPENAPPRWMFRNISAIRENTERIIELLEAGRAPAGEHFRTAA